MASIINTNIASLNAQRNLAASQTSLTTSMQRLSSGLRINSAKDDAAGLAITERFTTQIRGLNQAARNANDGISLAQTAEGALGEITANLQRIRELAVQSANSTNSTSDRAALNQEVQQRLAEIDRVALQTTFNNQKILDGTFGNAVFQVGANVGDTIAVGLSTSMRQDALGAIAKVTSTVDLRTLINPTPTAGTSTTGAITPTNFSGTAGTSGSSTLTFGSAAAAGDTVTLNGVTFTFAQGGASSETVVDAYNVTITRDMATTALTNNTTASSLVAGITAAKGGGAATAAALSTITAAASTNVVTLTDTKLGTAQQAERTATASIAAGAPTIALSATGTDGTAATAGTSTVNFTGGAVNGETVVLNGVTFTFTQASSASIIVNSPTSVLINRDIATTALTAATSAAALNDAIAIAKGNSQTTAALSRFTATIGQTEGIVRIADTAVGDAAYAGRTVTETSANASVTLSATGITGDAGKITVGGTDIKLLGNVASASALVTLINAGLDAANPPNTAVRASVNATDTTKIDITTTATGAAATAPVLGGDRPSVTNMIGGITTANGVASKSLAVSGSNFSVQIGSNAAVNVGAATYTTAQQLVDAVSTALGGKGIAAYESSTGLLTLSSDSAITVGGTTGTTTLGLAASTAVSGSLASVNVSTVNAANEAIQRVDVALTAVSGLRSTFGAIQNRFDSVIASLNITSENLSASRSRVQDADFAQETANLSRAQILQQAGTAMVAQANQLPQGVLALLR